MRTATFFIRRRTGGCWFCSDGGMTGRYRSSGMTDGERSGIAGMYPFGICDLDSDRRLRAAVPGMEPVMTSGLSAIHETKAELFCEMNPSSPRRPQPFLPMRGGNASVWANGAGASPAVARSELRDERKRRCRSTGNAALQRKRKQPQPGIRASACLPHQDARNPTPIPRFCFRGRRSMFPSPLLAWPAPSWAFRHRIGIPTIKLAGCRSSCGSFAALALPPGWLPRLPIADIPPVRGHGHDHRAARTTAASLHPPACSALFCNRRREHRADAACAGAAARFQTATPRHAAPNAEPRLSPRRRRRAAACVTGGTTNRPGRRWWFGT